MLAARALCGGAHTKGLSPPPALALESSPRDSCSRRCTEHRSARHPRACRVANAPPCNPPNRATCAAPAAQRAHGTGLDCSRRVDVQQANHHDNAVSAVPHGGMLSRANCQAFGSQGRSCTRPGLRTPGAQLQTPLASHPLVLHTIAVAQHTSQRCGVKALAAASQGRHTRSVARGSRTGAQLLPRAGCSIHTRRGCIPVPRSRLAHALPSRSSGLSRSRAGRPTCAPHPAPGAAMRCGFGGRAFPAPQQCHRFVVCCCVGSLCSKGAVVRGTTDEG